MVSVLSNQLQIRDDMDDILALRRAVELVEKENKTIKQQLEQTAKGKASLFVFHFPALLTSKRSGTEIAGS